MDAAAAIFAVIRDVGYPGPRIDEVYVDEVQDFTQAELRLFLACCADPNAVFLTGDTCQTIARGVGFRFDDITTMFFHLREAQAARRKAEGRTLAEGDCVQVPEVNKLSTNYRTHNGILGAASELVSLLLALFPASVDALAKDRGHFDGPRCAAPLALDARRPRDPARRLRPVALSDRVWRPPGGARPLAGVEGERLPAAFANALVLTIFEAKGLEFDDVFIFDFFEDSPADERTWRVVTGCDGRCRRGVTPAATRPTTRRRGRRRLAARRGLGVGPPAPRAAQRGAEEDVVPEVDARARQGDHLRLVRAAWARCILLFLGRAGLASPWNSSRAARRRASPRARRPPSGRARAQPDGEQALRVRELVLREGGRRGRHAPRDGVRPLPARRRRRRARRDRRPAAALRRPAARPGCRAARRSRSSPTALDLAMPRDACREAGEHQSGSLPPSARSVSRRRPRRRSRRRRRPRRRAARGTTRRRSWRRRRRRVRKPGPAMASMLTAPRPAVARIVGARDAAPPAVRHALGHDGDGGPARSPPREGVRRRDPCLRDARGGRSRRDAVGLPTARCSLGGGRRTHAGDARAAPAARHHPRRWSRRAPASPPRGRRRRCDLIDCSTAQVAIGRRFGDAQTAELRCASVRERACEGGRQRMPLVSLLGQRFDPSRRARGSARGACCRSSTCRRCSSPTIMGDRRADLALAKGARRREDAAPSSSLCSFHRDQTARDVLPRRRSSSASPRDLLAASARAATSDEISRWSSGLPHRDGTPSSARWRITVHPAWSHRRGRTGRRRAAGRRSHRCRASAPRPVAPAAGPRSERIDVARIAGRWDHRR